MKDLFITGSGTDVGKTVLSALLVAGLDAAYWKPIQSGHMGGEAETDRETVLRWTGMDEADAPPESYVFDPPVSPHLAAREARVQIDLAAIERPAIASGRRLVIEGAGGVLVPINDTELMLDLMARLNAAVVIATKTSLGTINHTLLTIGAIRNRDLDLVGVVMIGDEDPENRWAIEHYGRAPVVGWIPTLPTIERHTLLDTFESHFDRSCFVHG